MTSTPDGYQPQVPGGIFYNDIIKIVSQDGQSRLDIGSASLKPQSSDHNSWATMLQIKRLDGESTGVVLYSHVIGIFSQDGRVRLDIGSLAVTPQSPDHESWATQLFISNADNNERKPGLRKSGQVRYGDPIGIYSFDGKFRLDLGSDSMKTEVPASHDSWATRLNIQRVPNSIYVGRYPGGWT